MPAVSAVPADSYALAGGPRDDVWTDGIDEPDYFMAGNQRAPNQRERDGKWKCTCAAVVNTED